MTAAFDPSPWGAHLPDAHDRVVLALTRGMPANWLGQRLAILFRRLLMRRIGEGGIDTVLWGMRLRLYPRRNGCEKNALFTPQMFDVMERGVFAGAIDRCLLAQGTFTFVDIGANVGLHSLFVAAHSGRRARVLAIEPQPGILDRLRFNLAANPDTGIEVAAVALGDREGEVALVINGSDSGGTHIDKKDARPQGEERVTVPCRTLAAVLREAGIASVDVLKIDVEGAEDLVLAPFLRDAPAAQLPRMIVIEDTRGFWQTDVFALLAQRGYIVHARNRQNVALRLA